MPLPASPQRCAEMRKSQDALSADSSAPRSHRPRLQVVARTMAAGADRPSWSALRSRLASLVRGMSRPETLTRFDRGLVLLIPRDGAGRLRLLDPMWGEGDPPSGSLPQRG